MNGIVTVQRARAAGAVLIWCLALVVPVRGQEAEEATGPLLKADLVRMLATGDYTTDEVVYIVRMSCVSFRPTERDRRDLLALPHGDPVLSEISRCRTRGQAAGFSGGIPRANPVSSTAAEPPSESEALQVTTLSSNPLGSRPAPAAPRFTMVLVQKDQDALTVAEVPPRLQNWDEVSEQLLLEYRPNERRDGKVVLRVRVDETGRAALSGVRGGCTVLVFGPETPPALQYVRAPFSGGVANATIAVEAGATADVRVVGPGAMRLPAPSSR